MINEDVYMQTLRGLAFPNVHEKQVLKIKDFSKFFKDFLETEGVLIWALTVLFCYFCFILFLVFYELPATKGLYH